MGLLLGILSSLGMALYYMVKDRGGSTRTARALTLRIGVSIGLFILLLWAAPHVAFIEERILGFGWTPAPHWLFTLTHREFGQNGEKIDVGG